MLGTITNAISPMAIGVADILVKIGSSLWIRRAFKIIPTMKLSMYNQGILIFPSLPYPIGQNPILAQNCKIFWSLIVGVFLHTESKVRTKKLSGGSAVMPVAVVEQCVQLSQRVSATVQLPISYAVAMLFMVAMALTAAVWPWK